MPLAKGTTKYELGESPVTGEGLSYSAAELDHALSGTVAERIYDDLGRAEIIEEFMPGFEDTGFVKDRINQILLDACRLENWAVGEALANAYLEHIKNCFFPWNSNRDKRNSNASLQGADLVGFQTEGDKVFLVFGEVKTSSDRNYPPSVMHGRDGLKEQVNSLKNNEKKRDVLAMYLAHRAKGSQWGGSYKKAIKNYFCGKADISIYGVLIRDVEPNQADLESCVRTLAQEMPLLMTISILALYLPQGSIGGLSQKVADGRKGGAV